MEVLKRFRKSWRFPTALLCIYGFFSTVKPLEPFLVPFLTGPEKNLTAEQVNGQVFPVWTYSYLAVLVPVFLLTDWLRYKPVVVFQCCALFVTTALLRWLASVPAMQTMQFFYAVVTACDVAYFSYIYSMVEPQRYRRVTSYCRSVQLLGYTVGSVLGQILVSLQLLSFHGITEFTLVLTSIALVTSIFLPMPQQSMFFHRKVAKEPEGEGQGGGGSGPGEGGEGGGGSGAGEGGEGGGGSGAGEGGEGGGGGGGEKQVEESAGGRSCSMVLLQLFQDFRQCYRSRQLLYWSIWWAMATCGYNQTVNYVQFLWDSIQPSGNFSVYNGGVEAVSNLMGAATAYGVGFTEVRWERWGELALGVFSALGSGALFLMTFTSNIWLCYASYVLFKCLYMLLITIAMYQIAVDLSMERYALVFGVNNFAALTLQTIITSVVVDSTGLGLDIVPQFIIYSSYFSLIAVVFLVRGIFTLWKARRRQAKDSEHLPTSEPGGFEEHKF